jgi:hypothetical protein
MEVFLWGGRVPPPWAGEGWVRGEVRWGAPRLGISSVFNPYRQSPHRPSQSWSIAAGEICMGRILRGAEASLIGQEGNHLPSLEELQASFGLPG